MKTSLEDLCLSLKSYGCFPKSGVPFQAIIGTVVFQDLDWSPPIYWNCHIPSKWFRASMRVHCLQPGRLHTGCLA